MLKQFHFEYTWYDGIPFDETWFPMNCAGYDTVAITIVSQNGWDGAISFWGGAGADGESNGVWALNDASDNELISEIYNVVGATPAFYSNNFRGNIAGLAEFGIWAASAQTYDYAQGTITFKVGLYSSAK